MKQLAAGLIVLTVLAGGAHAAPFLPGSGGEVVETLRGGAKRAPRQARNQEPSLQPKQELEREQGRELRQLRSALAAQPRDVALAARVAQRYISIGRAEADPRYFGYAQAALAPWWSEVAAPPEVLLLRATLLQSTHQFDAAQRDLAALIKLQPANVQAWLTQATVQVVRADYAGARSSCARLASLAAPIVAAACAANVGAMTGQLPQSRALLAGVLARDGGADADVDAWVRTMLAEMAERAGDDVDAERWFTAALAGAPEDSYLLGARADYLLARGRAQEAAALLAAHTEVDGLLLRHALALRQLQRREELARASTELSARFAAAARRGDGLHQREQAMYELRLRGDARRALALASENWAVQKESADARLLLEAAQAAGQRAAAKSVLDWMRTSGVEDRRLQTLARGLEKT